VTVSEDVAGGVVKVIELVGSSPTSFSDAVRSAVRAASRTIRGIRGVEVVRSTADVDDNGALSLYKVTCKVAFLVEVDAADDGDDIAALASREPAEPPYVESGAPDDDR
jgi:dodecin